jgi:hypothetical protein
MLKVVNPLTEEDLAWARQFLLTLKCYSCETVLPIDGELTSGESKLVCTTCGCVHSVDIRMKSTKDHVTEDGRMRPRFLGERKTTPNG